MYVTDSHIKYQTYYYKQEQSLFFLLWKKKDAALLVRIVVYSAKWVSLGGKNLRLVFFVGGSRYMSAE